MKMLLRIGFAVALLALVRSSAVAVELPPGRSFTVSCGDVTLKFDSRKCWNINRIDYKGTPLTVDNAGSHFGVVASFPDRSGFVGSGHRETGFAEEIRDYIIRIDGREIDPESIADGAELSGSSLLVEKISRLRGLRLFTRIELRDGKLLETYEISAPRETKLKLLYFFMHPWLPEFSSCYSPESGEVELTTSGQFPLRCAAGTVWFHHAGLGMGVVSRLTEAPEPEKILRMVWDVKNYRKDYVRDCYNSVLPAGAVRRYAMTTEFRVVPDRAAWREWAGIQ